MRIVDRLPFQIETHDDIRIPMDDDVSLAARVWRPVGSDTSPVPAILEFLPYRRRDGTAERDALIHPYFAGHGYACVRVDIRGSGDSSGVLQGEYLKQEQDDALAILEWLERQPWCTGSVGMIGISWGGFNGLQVAARRPLRPILQAPATAGARCGHNGSMAAAFGSPIGCGTSAAMTFTSMVLCAKIGTRSNARSSPWAAGRMAIPMPCSGFSPT